MVSQEHNFSGSTDVFDNVAEIARACGRAPGDCIKCANDILKVFRQAGIEARKVELHSNWHFIIYKLEPDEAITETGRHFAVEAQSKIYDAFHPEGIAREEYINQFDVPSPFAMLELLEVE